MRGDPPFNARIGGCLFCCFHAFVDVLTSHFGPFAFTQALLPLLTQTCKEQGADVRIVNVRMSIYPLFFCVYFFCGYAFESRVIGIDEKKCPVSSGDVIVVQSYSCRIGVFCHNELSSLFRSLPTQCVTQP